jgi:hypothetical protein
MIAERIIRTRQDTWQESNPDGEPLRTWPSSIGWKVNADLPNPESFAGATQFVTPEQVAEQLACGPDVDEHVEKVRPFIDAGYTEVALVQVGADTQAEFISWAERELLPALRSL